MLRQQALRCNGASCITGWQMRLLLLVHVARYFVTKHAFMLHAHLKQVCSLLVSQITDTCKMFATEFIKMFLPCISLAEANLQGSINFSPQT